MVKIVDYDYGSFVDYKILNISENSKLHKDYVPYKKEIVYYEFEKDKQKIKDDYKKQLQKYEEELEDWKKEYVIQGSKHAHKSSLIDKWFGSPFEVRGVRVDERDTEIHLKQQLSTDILTVNIAELDSQYPNWKTEAIDIIGPLPVPPVKPDNYPKGRPRVRKTKKYKLTGEDKLYDEYMGRKKQYQTETNCPICNASIQFTEARKPPFDDRCEVCEYSFTFIYKKITERWKDPWGESGYIPYDGIKPTRPRAPFKGDYVSDGKRKPIPQDVMDKVWNRDEGKCTQCGSNENLEFDHIIPVSKGGANTYRNIQLLCEVCNREKSDNIG